MPQPNPWRRKLALFDRCWIIGLLVATAGFLVAVQDYAASRPNLVKYLTSQGFPNEPAARMAAFSIDEARWFVFLFALSAGVVLSGVALVWAQALDVGALDLAVRRS